MSPRPIAYLFFPHDYRLILWSLCLSILTQSSFEKVLRQITVWIVGTEINKEIYKVHDYSGTYAYYFDKMFQCLLLFWDLCLSQNLE